MISEKGKVKNYTYVYIPHQKYVLNDECASHKTQVCSNAVATLFGLFHTDVLFTLCEENGIILTEYLKLLTLKLSCPTTRM